MLQTMKQREFIFINNMIFTGILTPSGVNRNETKWTFVCVNIYKVNLARFNSKFGCA